MDNGNTQLQRRRRGPENARRDDSIRLRNWLNLIFMVGALAGILIYFFGDRTTGSVVILVAMVFKIIESAIRFLH